MDRARMRVRAMRGSPKPVFVLVVDDFEDTREIYAAYLRHLGYRTATAENGEEGVRLARHLKPDVVVLDLAMPVLDGWEAARQLRMSEETRAMAIIALTGHASAVNRRRAMEAGCDHFLEKPCLPEELDRFIREVLARRE